MPLSARRGLKPRKHKAAAVGMVSRSLSALVDSILPSATLLALFATGVMSLRLFDPLPEVTRVDAVFRRLYETPRLGVRVVANWMLLWTAFTLIFYGLFKNSPGKLL
ncbi:MAG: hypothetical protein KC561_20355, partial [Myxococcales bacterium]|nr:hypothetical protein [Myxococcales bacterium]